MEEQLRISKLEGSAMIFFALCLDFFQIASLALLPISFISTTGILAFIPVVGQLLAGALAAVGVGLSFIFGLYLSFIGLVIMGCWFWMKDLPFGASGRLAAAGLVEFIPILNYVPALTLGTWLSIRAANGKGGLMGASLLVMPGGVVAKGAALGGAAALSQRNAVIARAEAEKRSVNAAEIASLTPSPILEGDDRSQEALDRSRRVGVDMLR